MKEDAMSSIVAPAIEAEVSYRHDRATEDFRRARPYRRSRNWRNVGIVIARVTAWADVNARGLE